ncbi:MAG: hypothetical protein INR73_28540 [Williamsia sp.]|nr:hypothetical protein [Williamsia sp.]
MRVLSALAACFLFVFIILISCGKDHHDEDNPPQIPPATDTIPGTDSLPTEDTTGTAIDSLPAGWQVATTPSLTSLVSDVFFTNNTTGYAITSGDGGVWKSTDGGLSWAINSASFAGTPPQLANLAVTPDDKVFIVDGWLERSVSGAPFQRLSFDNKIVNNDVYFTSNDTGYVSGGVVRPTGQYCLWKTTDGGISWQATGVQPLPYPNPTVGVHEFAFSPGGNGYETYGSKILYKKAADTTWLASAAVTPAVTQPFNSVSAPEGDIAFAVTRNGVVYKSVDGGENFAKVGVIGNGLTGYLNLHFVDENTGYCTVNTALYKTTDGGATWQIALKWKYALIEVHFTDAEHGWVCGTNGTILTYTP